MQNHSNDGTRGPTEDDAVVLLVTTFECCGATFTLNDDNRLWVDFNGLGLPPPPYADALSAAVLLLREPIKDYLKLRAADATVQ